MSAPLAILQVQLVKPEQFGPAAADLATATLKENPAAVLGLPTGNTPIPLYRELLRRQQQGLDLSRVRVAMLDEYLGATERVSFYSWLRHYFLAAAGIGPERVLRMPWRPEGIETACADYERQLAAWGGCDLQLLGLGLNGHIGFNEPGSPCDSRTRVVPLSELTRDANEEYWQGADVPRFGVTTGIAVILQARRIGLLVSGERKREILRLTLEGPMSAEVPASFLRQAREVQVIADHAAAGEA